jgi:hypothetical protein
MGGREKETHKNFSQNLKGTDIMVYLGVDGRIILKWILKKWSVRMLFGFMWLRIGSSGRLV